MARSYPRDRATAERLLTIRASKAVKLCWLAVSMKDEDLIQGAGQQLYGILAAADALGLDGDRIEIMAQRFNSLSPEKIEQEYGDLIGVEADTE